MIISKIYRRLKTSAKAFIEKQKENAYDPYDYENICKEILEFIHSGGYDKIKTEHKK